MSLKSIRKICMISLPVILTVASILYFFGNFSYQQGLFTVASFYTVALTANIGYFTNYLAIKMLFKPYHKTAFGRQGLIPKNQTKLADSLSHTLIENFLSQDQWREYLLHSDLVNKVLFDAKSGSLNWLQKPENNQLISQLIAEYLTEHQEIINQYLGELQTRLTRQVSDNIDPQLLLAQGFQWLEKKFEDNPQQMQNMIEPIIKTVAENIPEIAESLVNALDSHIEKQDTIKKNIAKVAKWSTDFSVDDIKSYLFTMVASFEFRQTLFYGLKKLIQEYNNKPILLNDLINKGENSRKELSISQLIEKLANSSFSSINYVDLFIQQLLQSNFNQVVLSAHDKLFTKIESELNDGPLHSWIIDELISMIEKLDLREMIKNKAANFSPKQMESIFQNMLSEHLVFIELFGAVLGGLSGLALIDIGVFAMLTGLFGCYFIADNFFTRRNQQPSNTSTSTSIN